MLWILKICYSRKQDVQIFREGSCGFKAFAAWNWSWKCVTKTTCTPSALRPSVQGNHCFGSPSCWAAIFHKKLLPVVCSSTCLNLVWCESHLPAYSHYEDTLDTSEQQREKDFQITAGYLVCAEKFLEWKNTILFQSLCCSLCSVYQQMLLEILRCILLWSEFHGSFYHWMLTLGTWWRLRLVWNIILKTLRCVCVCVCGRRFSSLLKVFWRNSGWYFVSCPHSDDILECFKMEGITLAP